MVGSAPTARFCSKCKKLVRDHTAATCQGLSEISDTSMPLARAQPVGQARAVPSAAESAGAAAATAAAVAEYAETRQYAVAQVVARRCNVDAGMAPLQQYKVRWRGYSESEDTWHSPDELPPENIEEFEHYLRLHPDEEEDEEEEEDEDEEGEDEDEEEEDEDEDNTNWQEKYEQAQRGLIPVPLSDEDAIVSVQDGRAPNVTKEALGLGDWHHEVSTPSTLPEQTPFCDTPLTDCL